MFTPLEIFIKVFSSFNFILTVVSLTFITKFGFLLLIIYNGLKATKLKRSWLYLLLVITSSLFSDFSWILKTSEEVFMINIGYKYILFTIRLAWAWYSIQYQSLSLAIENLSDKKQIVPLYQKIFIFFSVSFSSYFLYIAFAYFNTIANQTHIELMFMQFSVFYSLILLAPSLYRAFLRVRYVSFPRILKRQIKVFIQFLVIPMLIADFLQYLPSPDPVTNNYVAVTASTILLTFALFFCIKKIIGLRFLNFYNHVQPTKISLDFIDDFKVVLEQLGHTSDIKELQYIVQGFFKTAFAIQPSRTALYTRRTPNMHMLDTQTDESEVNTSIASISSLETIIENFIIRHEPTTYNCEVSQSLLKDKMLITDEIAFTDFYNETESTKEMLQFLNQINADIFLPIFDKSTIIGYIIVERDARTNEFYNRIERDEMIVFASYLANIINLLQNHSLSSIIQKDKELSEELYRKHQEVNQYKESIRSFLRNTSQRKIGIIFYKNRQFFFGNQEAKEIIPINLNIQEGHFLTKELRSLAKKVVEYKSAQTILSKDLQGNKLVLSALQNLEHNNIIIMAYYPEISDLIKKQVDLLQDPTEWDYLLYLETTKIGSLINQLVPGRSTSLLNFKVSLLKSALSKKAPLIDMHEDDLLPTVELLHHVSMRQQLYVLDLQGPEQNFETAIKLFGINPLFNLAQNKHNKSVLQQLHGSGTLFIKNVHFLDHETQQHLAEFIRYGYYRLFKSTQKILCDVRIITSSNYDLKLLVQQQKFSKLLYNELQQTKISLPSLLTLPKTELDSFAEVFTEQAMKNDTYQNIMQLTEKDKNQLTSTAVASLQEIKRKVLQLLVKKSKKNDIHHEMMFDQAYNITDPELAKAARLGKNALKDPKILAMLLAKFKNQNQIASFLGVNRSSINRRCKEFNL